MVVTILVAAIACALAATVRADAVIPRWDFQTTSGSWTGSWDNTLAPADKRWIWTGTYSGTAPITGGTSSHWHILAQGVGTGWSNQNAYYLTSPVFSGLVDSGTNGLVPAKNARISIAHNFLLRMGTNGVPITTGQLEYQLNNSGTWVGLPLSAFTSGTSVLTDFNIDFGYSPFRTISGSLQFVDQVGYVAPNYVLPTGTAALHFGAPGGAAFTGTTAGWSTSYVPSQGFLNANTGLPSTGITDLQVRFTNLNLGTPCSCGTYDDGWNIRFVQVDFASTVEGVPEPATIALGASGLAGMAGMAALRRRRRHQRASRPSDSP
ncbi:MAG: PEP-CTERM sorting domain-containing protein [Planctomycetaceae bacterium]